MAALSLLDSGGALMLPTDSATHNFPGPTPTIETPEYIAGLQLLETAGLAEACRDATARLAESNGLGNNWVPILETLRDVENGGYSIQFTNFNNPGEVREVMTEDPSFKKFKANLDSNTRAIDQSFTVENGRVTSKKAATDAGAISGVNAMNIVKTIINQYTKSSTPDDTKFGKALQMQAYVNYAQYGRQGAEDIGKLVNIVRTLRGSKAIGPRLSSAVKALGRLSVLADVGLGAANLGLDISELRNARTETELAVAGTHTAFDSASLAVNTASIAAGYVGASTTAAVLGGAGVILGGLAIGFGALAQAFGDITKDAQGVGKYFGDVEKAYKAGGYKYDKENKSLIPVPGAVITELNMMTGKVQFGTQYIYRSRHGGLGSGKTNMITMMPYVDFKREDALAVRDGIEAPPSGTLPNYADCNVITLPATPRSYIGYYWANLPGCTSRHDYGFDVIRRLEKNETFDYDFYTFPSEYTITSIWHQYTVTPVIVHLPNRPVYVKVPSPPKEQHDYLQYTVHGVGKQYTIALEAGVQITLTSTDKDTCWLFDAPEFSSDKFKVEDKTVTLDNLSASITGQFSSVLIAGRDGEVFRVDLGSKKILPVKEDAAKYPGGSPALVEHLKSLSTEQGGFVVIENYTVNGKDVGRAFYDVVRKRVLYTANAPKELMEDAQFLDAGEDHFYFYNIRCSSIWLVNPANGVCQAKYKPYLSGKLKRIWQEDTSVFVVFGYDDSHEGLEATYVLRPGSMTFISIIAPPVKLEMLDSMAKWKSPFRWLMADLPGRWGPSLSPTDGPGIEPDLNPVLFSVSGQDTGRNYRFWLRVVEGEIQQQIPTRSIIKAKFPPPDDLVLAGTITPPGGDVEEFYFYSRKEKMIRMQTGTGLQTSDAKEVKVPPESGELSNVITNGGTMFALTTLGYSFRIGSQGTFTLAAVTQQWFKQFKTGQQGPWWNVLKQKVNSDGATVVTILGLHDNSDNNKVVPAWIYDGTIVIASSTLSGKPLEVAGLDGRGGAWLRCITEKGDWLCYNQPLVPEERLTDVLSLTTTGVTVDKIPPGREVLVKHSLKTVAMTNSGLQCITAEGLILIVNVTIDESIETQLCGVDEVWQSSHCNTMEADLGKLLEQWKHREVIDMVGYREGGDSEDKVAWYLVPAGKLVTRAILGDLGWYKAVYLGTDTSTDGGTGWFHFPSSGIIRQGGDYTDFDDPPDQQPVIMAVRSGDAIITVPKRRANFSLIALRNVRYFMLSQVDGGGAECTIPQASWQHYQAIAIQWKNSGQINVKSENAAALVARKDGDDLVIFDPSSNHFLMIRKAFGTDSAYTKVTLKFTSLDFSITAADIQSTQAWLNVNADPTSPPDVTMETVGRHLKSPELGPQSFMSVPGSSWGTLPL